MENIAYSKETANSISGVDLINFQNKLEIFFRNLKIEDKDIKILISKYNKLSNFDKFKLSKYVEKLIAIDNQILLSDNYNVNTINSLLRLQLNAVVAFIRNGLKPKYTDKLIMDKINIINQMLNDKTDQFINDEFDDINFDIAKSVDKNALLHNVSNYATRIINSTALMESAKTNFQPERLPSAKPELIYSSQPERLPFAKPELIPSFQPERLPFAKPELISSSQPEKQLPSVNSSQKVTLDLSKDLKQLPLDLPKFDSIPIYQQNKSTEEDLEGLSENLMFFLNYNHPLEFKDEFIRKYNNFVLDTTNIDSDLKKIGQVSANGFNSLIKVKNNFDKNFFYNVIKISNQSDSDNNYYEFYAGKCINELKQFMPNFVYTFNHLFIDYDFTPLHI